MIKPSSFFALTILGWVLLVATPSYSQEDYPWVEEEREVTRENCPYCFMDNLGTGTVQAEQLPGSYAIYNLEGYGSDWEKEGIHLFEDGSFSIMSQSCIGSSWTFGQWSLIGDTLVLTERQIDRSQLVHSIRSQCREDRTAVTVQVVDRTGKEIAWQQFSYQVPEGSPPKLFAKDFSRSWNFDITVGDQEYELNTGSAEAGANYFLITLNYAENELFQAPDDEPWVGKLKVMGDHLVPVRTYMAIKTNIAHPDREGFRLFKKKGN